MAIGQLVNQVVSWFWFCLVGAAYRTDRIQVMWVTGFAAGQEMFFSVGIVSVRMYSSLSGCLTSMSGQEMFFSVGVLSVRIYTSLSGCLTSLAIFLFMQYLVSYTDLSQSWFLCNIWL